MATQSTIFISLTNGCSWSYSSMSAQFWLNNIRRTDITFTRDAWDYRIAYSTYQYGTLSSGTHSVLIIPQASDISGTLSPGQIGQSIWQFDTYPITEKYYSVNFNDGTGVVDTGGNVTIP